MHYRINLTRRSSEVIKESVDLDKTHLDDWSITLADDTHVNSGIEHVTRLMRLHISANNFKCMRKLCYRVFTKIANKISDTCIMDQVDLTNPVVWASPF